MHSFHPSFLREYDARGIVGEALTENDAYFLGKAFGTLVVRNGGTSISIGRDGRHSSLSLETALAKGLADTGLKVIKVGLGPTPMIYYSVYELGTDGCIMVTGSHNPPEYNGFKMMLGEKTIYGEEIASLGILVKNGDLVDGEGSIEENSLKDRYIERILKDMLEINLAVGWDPANGSAGEVTQEVVKRLGGRHEVINGEIDGDFPDHPADPTVEKNLTSLRKLVKDNNLDLGIGFDGDGDRIGVIDTNGRIIWGDQLLAILAAEVLEDLPGSHIIADVKSSQIFYDEVSRLGGKPVMWKTGHSLVKAKMKEINAPLAGEMSGHIFFKHRYYGFDDAIYAALRLLSIVEKSGGDIAKLIDKLPQMVNTPEMRIDCPDADKFNIIEDIIKRLNADGADIDNIDGARVTTKDGWWLLRASNTQPALVARCESSTQEGLERLMNELKGQLNLSSLTLSN
jgi:phosphomannomutase